MLSYVPSAITAMSAITDNINQRHTTHEPSFGPITFEPKTALHLINASRDDIYHEFVERADVFMLCSYDGDTYLLDQNLTLWTADSDGILEPCVSDGGFFYPVTNYFDDLMTYNRYIVSDIFSVLNEKGKDFLKSKHDLPQDYFYELDRYYDGDYPAVHIIKYFKELETADS